jgi:DNA-binding CsgD family transcriptional regulator/pimeloyl-ACP methyl ester carboxylesterase
LTSVSEWSSLPFFAPIRHPRRRRRADLDRNQLPAPVVTRSTSRRAAAPAAGFEPPPPVRYLASATGPRIAWTASGTGRPALLVCAGWLSHLDLDWSAPASGELHRTLAQQRRLLRYDRPGTGLADREPLTPTLEGEVDIVERVVDAGGEAQVALLAAGLAAPIAIGYAALHPHRVSHLVLFAPALGGLDSGAGTGRLDALTDALGRLIRADWGLATGTLAELMLPGGDAAARRGYADYQRMAASPEAAAELLIALSGMDVTALLDRVTAPTLVLHRRDSRAAGVGAARLLAAQVRGARLRLLDGSEQLITHGDVGTVLAEITAFLEPAATLLTAREVEILALAAEGLSNRAIARQVILSEHTVARHLANVFLKLDVGSRSAAAAHARRIGVLPGGLRPRIR